MDDLQAAWDELHAALPPGWVAGRPWYREDLRTWEQYAYRPTERAIAGKRRDEWTATAASEAACVRELARCVLELRDARWPR